MTVLDATVKQHSKKIVLGATVKQDSKKIYSSTEALAIAYT